MADNFLITQGSGTTIATHQNVDLSHEQKVQVTVSALPAGASTEAGATGGTHKTQLVDSLGDTAAISAAGALSVDINAVGINALGQELMAASLPVVIASNQSTVPVTITGSVQLSAANLAVTATGVAAAAVTLTLPAIVAQFHYITLLEIEAYSTAARTGTATPVIVTSTNLSGSPAWTFASAAAIGTTDTKLYVPAEELRSSVVNTATTIVCPATTSVIWRVNVWYFAAP